MVRWSLVVSRETDIALRTLLAQQGMRKGDLSRFVEDAVRWRVLDSSVERIRGRNRAVAPAEMNRAIDAALVAARSARSGSAKRSKRR
jgi:3-oxoacyl-[acyl-carrier-protein] synthase III